MWTMPRRSCCIGCINGPNKGQFPAIAHHSCKPGSVPLVPFVVSPVSFHSRKPNCTEFSFL